MATMVSSSGSVAPKRDRREDVVEQPIRELRLASGATITCADVERHWRFYPSTSAQVLEALTAERVIVPQADGTYTTEVGTEPHDDWSEVNIVWVMISLGLIATAAVVVVLR
jgi:hypothetical protein